MGKGLVALDQAFDFYFQNRDYVRAVEAMSNAPTVDPENPENARRLRQALEVVDAGSVDEALLLHKLSNTMQGNAITRDPVEEDE